MASPQEARGVPTPHSQGMPRNKQKSKVTATADPNPQKAKPKMSERSKHIQSRKTGAIFPIPSKRQLLPRAPPSGPATPALRPPRVHLWPPAAAVSAGAARHFGRLPDPRSPRQPKPGRRASFSSDFSRENHWKSIGEHRTTWKIKEKSIPSI